MSDRLRANNQKDITIELADNAKLSAEDGIQYTIISTNTYLHPVTIKGNGTIESPKYTGTESAAIQAGSKGGFIIDGVTVKNKGGNSAGTVNAAVIVNRGHVTINGGYFYAANNAAGKPNPCIYIASATSQNNNAIVNITGGVFDSESLSDNSLITVKSGVNTSYVQVNITGGTFVGFNPAESSVITIPTGYESVETTYEGKQAWTVQKK